MDLKLSGKTVLITGASKGIGACCARSFASEGCHLILIARNTAMLEALAADIRAKHPVKVETFGLDLRDPADLGQASALCARTDILVNNAGDIPPGTVEQIDDARWRHAWELKVFGYISLARAAFSAMRARSAGTIINVIGMAGERPTGGYICGATANAALAAFTKGLGQDALATGVRVMGVHPPATRTDRIEMMMRAMALKHYGDETRTADLLRDGLIEPSMDPEQVADAVVYLASPRASQMSGIVLNMGRVNG